MNYFFLRNWARIKSDFELFIIFYIHFWLITIIIGTSAYDLIFFKTSSG